MSSSTKKLLLGVAFGAIAGMVVGYLLSGKKMSDLANDLDHLTDRFKDKENAANKHHPEASENPGESS